jgi:hypothetical protein
MDLEADKGNRREAKDCGLPYRCPVHRCEFHSTYVIETLDQLHECRLASARGAHQTDLRLRLISIEKVIRKSDEVTGRKRRSLGQIDCAPCSASISLAPRTSCTWGGVCGNRRHQQLASGRCSWRIWSPTCRKRPPSMKLTVRTNVTSPGVASSLWPVRSKRRWLRAEADP